jgi:hypothetical protein
MILVEIQPNEEKPFFAMDFNGTARFDLITIVDTLGNAVATLERDKSGVLVAKIIGKAYLAEKQVSATKSQKNKKDPDCGCKG